MSISPEDLQATKDLIALRAPEYEDDPRLEPLIELAYELKGDKIPEGTPSNYAMALQVLHWLTISDRTSEGNGGVGSVTEEKEGELTIKYSGSNSNLMWYTSSWESELGQTPWGKELYAFVNRWLLKVHTRFSI